MGSYSELRLASLYLGSVKDEVDPLLMTLFRETDKHILPTATRDIELVHDYALEDLDEDEVVPVVQYVCSASVAKDRLDLTGFTTKGKLGKYQGEVLNKSTLQYEFDGKLEACEKDPSQINRYDWTGLQSIITEMRKAFQERDATEILGRISGD